MIAIIILIVTWKLFYAIFQSECHVNIVNTLEI